MINYGKLWLLLDKRGMKRTDLLESPCKLSSKTLATLGKNGNVTTDTICKICDFLECQPGDIMENISPKAKQEAIEKMQEAKGQLNELLNSMAVLQGKSKEEIIEEIQKSIPDALDWLNQS